MKPINDRAMIIGPAIAAALDREGFPLPKDCREMRLIVGVDAAIEAQFAVLLTIEQLQQLGRALASLGEDLPA